jgi:benzylsuccinate synthase
MATCGECASYFKLQENDPDYEQGLGDCVMQKQDQKGTFWLSKPVYETDAGCAEMKSKR